VTLNIASFRIERESSHGPRPVVLIILNVFWPVDHFLRKKFPMDQFAMLTPHEKLVVIVLHVSQ